MMTKLRSFFAALVMAELLCVASVHAQPLIVDQEVTLEFEPSAAFLLLDIDGITKKVKALVVPPFVRSESGQGESSWLVGSFLDIPARRELHFSVIVYGAKGEVKSFPPVVWEAEEGVGYRRSSSALRDRLGRRKAFLVDQQKRVRANEANLKRLRADADTIADVARIIEVKEESERANKEIQNIEKDMEKLRRFLKLSKSDVQPKNFSRREVELTKQLAELAAVAKTTETGEFDRVAATHAAREEELELVESTRFEDIDQLKQELAEVRQEREELQRRLSPETTN